MHFLHVKLSGDTCKVAVNKEEEGKVTGRMERGRRKRGGKRKRQRQTGESKGNDDDIA